MSADGNNFDENIQPNHSLGYLEDFKQSIARGKQDLINFGKEFIYEITPPPADEKSKETIITFFKTWAHIPYLPAFHQPGWLLKYLIGPYDIDWIESILADIWAGLTVGLTLIPQGLSYATLANIQPIQGLYAAVLPAAIYTFYGSALQLAVGPVAIVSLLTGSIVAKYVPNYAQAAYFTQASDVAAEVALAVGATLTVLSIINAGNFIRYISFPVMSGFTSGAACVIGLNQLKNAFGFSNSDVPQQGQQGYQYNYEVIRWFMDHWYDRYRFTQAQLTKPTGSKATQANLDKYYSYVIREGELTTNKFAIQICFSLYAALMVIIIAKNAFKETPERNKKFIYKFWTYLAALAPFIGIIISARMAFLIKKHDHFTDPNYLYPHQYDAHYLKIVGETPSGLNFLKTPTIPIPFKEILRDSIPVALIAFMEAYSVARRIATKRGELHILNASQELWANGVANLLAAVSSGYPVSGSFSRSALNYSCGARTPLSKITTMIVIIVALGTLASTFQYIPQAALAAVIFAAVYNLISLEDLWEAWRNNKKDFITMVTTWTLVLAFNTEVGLAAGLSMSALFVLLEMAFADTSKAIVTQSARENDGVVVVQLRQDLNFVTHSRFRDFVQTLFFIKPVGGNSENDRLLDRWFYAVSSFLDYYLLINKPVYAEFVPKAIVLDFSIVSTVDLTGVQGLAELQNDARRFGVKIIVINAIPFVEEQLIKYGITNDLAPELDKYSNLTGKIPSRDLTKRLTGVSLLDIKKYKSISNGDVEDSKENGIVVKHGAAAGEEV